MQYCAYCQKKFVIKMIVSLLDLKSKEIESGLHISKSVISRHLSGERDCPEIDIYIIEKLFGIKIKDYSING